MVSKIPQQHKKIFTQCMWEWKLKYNIFYYHPNKMKHINLTKCTPGLYAENYKTLLKEIK